MTGTHDGHRKRLRDRFENAGLAGFADHEVLELLLTLAAPRKDCKPEAKALLGAFSSLAGVFDARAEQLLEVDGIGPAKAFSIRLVKAVCERYLENRLEERPLVGTPTAVFDYLYGSMRGLDREVFKVLHLDAKNRLIAVEDLFSGSITASPVYPRVVIQSALVKKSVSVIFAHNHPSGDPEPSREDIAITRRLLRALSAIGIGVHEHLVIGDNRYYSFAEAGMMDRLRREEKEAEAAFLREWGA